MTALASADFVRASIMSHYFFFFFFPFLSFIGRPNPKQKQKNKRGCMLVLTLQYIAAWRECAETCFHDITKKKEKKKKKKRKRKKEMLRHNTPVAMQQTHTTTSNGNSIDSFEDTGQGLQRTPSQKKETKRICVYLCGCGGLCRQFFGRWLWTKWRGVWNVNEPFDANLFPVFRRAKKDATLFSHAYTCEPVEIIQQMGWNLSDCNIDEKKPHHTYTRIPRRGNRG